MALFIFGRTPTPCGTRFDPRNSRLLLWRFNCRAMRIITIEGAPEFASVIRIDLCVILTARNRHVRKTIVN